MRNNVYRFQPDKPTVIRLKYRTGKPFKMGDVSGYTYTLDNGLTTRFPETVDHQIQALHLDIGQPFLVTKRTLTTGEYAWDIEFQSAPVQQGGSNNSTLPPAILTTEHGRTILRQLIGMVEIVHAVESYAKRMGRPIHFSPQDIRSLAISCFIQQSHEAIEESRLEAARVA